MVLRYWLYQRTLCDEDLNVSGPDILALTELCDDDLNVSGLQILPSPENFV